MRFHIGFSKRINLKTFVKIIIGLLALVGIYFGSTSMVYAEVFNDNNKLTYIFTENNNNTIYTGNVPFRFDYNGSIVGRKLYLEYTDYIAYDQYYYDITFTVYFDSQYVNLPNDNQFLNSITSCNIFVNGSYNQFNDGCTILEQSSSHIKIKTTNLKSYTQGKFQFQFNSGSVVYGTMTVQVSNYALDIIAKPDTSVSDQTINNATNSIINNNNNNTQSIIDNNNQNTQEITDSIDDLNDSLTDDNVSDSISNAEDLIDDIDVSEPIGLTSIITSPIRLLQSLINGGSCNGFTFSINLNGTDKSVTIPSGCILWDNVPSTVVALYQTMIFGLFGYRLLIDMVHFIDSLRDPDKKNEYTLDL